MELEKYTKRTILSKMSMLYDPLGLASPVTIKMRKSMQDIWRSKSFDWDDPLSKEIEDIWKSHFKELEKLEAIKFPRCLKPKEKVDESSELHVFCDSSLTAYGAVAYIKWPLSHGNHVQLIAAKARVAPLRQSTIPRLELMGALVASRLAKTIFDEFRLKPSAVYLWSDSKIVLHWIKSDSLNLKAFVGVRVTEIQSTWDSSKWYYVPSEENVADDLSRGLSVYKLSDRWMNGPSFLQCSEVQWPVQDVTPIQDDVETKQKSIYAISKPESVIDISRFSSLSRLIRTMAYCYRSINNLKIKSRILPKEVIQIGTITPEEYVKAENYLVMVSQNSIGNWEENYRDLSPFMSNKIVRVGGRLRHSPLSYEQNHPILLPRSSHISELIMKDVHTKLCHVGAERTLGESRRKYWILQGRSLAKKIVRQCVICRKLRQPPHTTIMGDLPPGRLKPMSPIFTVTGIDLFGPMLLKYGRNKNTKVWGAIFTCANVRAIHLEIVQDLSTPSFLHALRRFAANHGWPSVILSDNGSNFIGAHKEVKKLYQEGKKEIEDFGGFHKVRWKFSTPLSPHQGGIYERLIKQIKRCIQVFIGHQILNWNELSTLFSEIKCLIMINSRPIGYSPDNPNDLHALTPNHFVMGRATNEIPQGPFEETKNLHRRFEFVQSLVQHFWKRFIREYIPTMMRRVKWRIQNRQVQVNDVVLLVDYTVSRGRWNLGRVTQVYPGLDGVVRNVLVKTKSGTYQRSVQKCCIILQSEDHT